MPGLNNNICVRVDIRTPPALFIARELGQVDVVETVNEIIINQRISNSSSTSLYFVDSENFTDLAVVFTGIIYKQIILSVEIRQIYLAEETTYNRRRAIVQLAIVCSQNPLNRRRCDVWGNYFAGV